MKHVAHSLFYNKYMLTLRGDHLISCETAHHQTLLELGLKPRPLVACLAFGKAMGILCISQSQGSGCPGSSYAALPTTLPARASSGARGSWDELAGCVLRVSWRGSSGSSSFPGGSAGSSGSMATVASGLSSTMP